MTLGKYRNIGLRRDRNLSDVEDPYESLKNILDNLAGAGEIFVPEDLEPINGIRNTDVTPTRFREVLNTAVRYTDETRQIRFVTPLITIKDTVDNAKVITGDPPFLSGGDGPLAVFSPSNNILQNPTANTTGDQLIINSARLEGPTYFWDNGIFQLINKIYPTFNDSYGLIQWEGYITQDPDQTNFRYPLTTSGLSLVEMDLNDDGNWETLSSIYASVRTYTLANTDISSVDQSTVSLNNEDITKFIGINDKLISFNGVDVSGSNILIQSYSTSSITFNQNVSGFDWAAANVELVFEMEIGGEGITSHYIIPKTFYDDKIKIRYTLWWPDPGDSSIYSVFAVFRDPSSGLEFLPYYKFYSVKPEVKEPNRLSIEFFYKNNLTPWSKNTNAQMSINNSMLIDYSPPLERVDRYKGTVSMAYSGRGQYALSSGSFSDLAIGDYICLSDSYIQASAFPSTNTMTAWFEFVEDIPASFTTTVTSAVKFGSNGLVGIYNYNDINETMTAISSEFDVNDIQPDHVVISPTTSNAYRILDRIISGTTAIVNMSEMVINPTQPMTSSIVAVYRDKALEDRSKDTYCVGVFAKRTSAQALADQNEIVLDDVTGITTSPTLYAQFEGTIDTFANVTAINGNTITIGQPLLRNLPEGSTVTFSPDTTNREICNIALDTAPPFIGTDTGLETAPGTEGIRGNILGFKELILNDMPISSVTELSNFTGNVFTEELTFTSNGKSYRFLIA